MRRTDRYISVQLRVSMTTPIQTFEASDFAGKAITVVNTHAQPSFFTVGMLRQVLGAGEEARVEIPQDANYRIGLGSGVRLVEQL